MMSTPADVVDPARRDGGVRQHPGWRRGEFLLMAVLNGDDARRPMPRGSCLNTSRTSGRLVGRRRAWSCLMGTLKCISYMAGTLRSSTDTSTESSNRFSRRVEVGEQSTMSPRETLREARRRQSLCVCETAFARLRPDVDGAVFAPSLVQSGLPIVQHLPAAARCVQEQRQRALVTECQEKIWERDEVPKHPVCRSLRPQGATGARPGAWPPRRMPSLPVPCSFSLWSQLLAGPSSSPRSATSRPPRDNKRHHQLRLRALFPAPALAGSTTKAALHVLTAAAVSRARAALFLERVMAAMLRT